MLCSLNGLSPRGEEQSDAFNPSVAKSQAQREVGLGWADCSCETQKPWGQKALSVFSYLDILAAGRLYFHISFMPATKPFSPFPMSEGPVISSLGLDDPPHELLLVHWCTDDFQVVSVDDDLAKI